MTRACFPIAALLVAAALASVLIFAPQLPETVPIHWNLRGEVDGYGPPYLLPAIMGGLLVLFRLLPWLSPKQFEIDAFRSTYERILLLVIGLLGYVHGLLLLTYLGVTLEIGRWLVGGIFLMFALLGNLLGKVRRNFYLGVRTPWTIASERVWNDTHRLAAWLFVGAGVAGVLAAAAGLPLWIPWLLIPPVAIIPVVYSLVLYKRLERRGDAP